MSFSIGKLGPITPNVNDEQCLSFEIYVPGELKTSFNVDVNVLLETLVLTLRHIYWFFFLKNLQHFLCWKFKSLKNKVSTRSNKYELIYVQWMLIIVCGLFIHILSYGLTHCACSLSVWNLSKFHKFNFNWCLGLWGRSKRKHGVKHNDSCLWFLWCYFTCSVMYKIRFSLPFIIFIVTSWTSLIHVVNFIHNSRMNKSPCIWHPETKQMIYIFAKVLITKLSFTTQKT